MEATRLHRSLGTTYDAPVDVLGIARNLGLVLMMQPLDNLLGFYVRQPEAAGIVINSRVPESLQRFTLAHEIGHHVLGHEGTADDQHTLDRFDPDSLVEVQAQAFAAALLMPLPLVNRALRDLPATRLQREIRDTDAYLYSRQLGVSFSAGVWSLYRQHRLPLNRARTFIKSGARAAKSAITGQDPIANARADVWVLNEENDDLTVLCRVGDEIHVQLNEDTSTGTAWVIQSPEITDFYHPSTAQNQVNWDGMDGLTDSGTQAPVYGHEDAGTLEVVQDEHRSDVDTDTEGALLRLAHRTELPFPSDAGIREVTFVPREEGATHVRMKLARPWDRDGETLRSYGLDLLVRPRQLAAAGLLSPQIDTWVEEHAVTA